MLNLSSVAMSKPHIPFSFVPVEALTKPQVYWKRYEDAYARNPSEGEQDLDRTECIPEESRRRFISLMGASLALAGAIAGSGCTRQPPELIVPYVDPPENEIPGKPKRFATAVPLSGGAEGVIVETHLGRPTKIEGNPDHPASLGASSVLSQASVLDLYDPDRAVEISYRGTGRTWEEFLLDMRGYLEPLRASSGSGLHILTESILSPCVGAQIDAVLQAFPEARWHQWEPAGGHSARGGAQQAFGRFVNTTYQLESADVVLSLDSDFLATGPACTRYAHDFAMRRRRGDRLDMNRLYVIESSMTSTGGKADHRLPVRYDAVESFARNLMAALQSAAAAPADGSADGRFLAAVTRDLRAHQGASVVIAGDHESPGVHALTHRLNSMLGNVGRTVTYTEPIEFRPADSVASIKQLTADLTSGSVRLLLILGGNPVYNAPADLSFSESLSKASASIHVGLHFNETSAFCQWHIPESHFLEDWGDCRSFDGTISILQPMILPLYRSRSHLEVLDALLTQPGRSTYAILRDHWSGQRRGTAQDFETWWRKSVHDGLIADSKLPAIQPALTPVPAAAQAVTPAASGETLEIVLRPDPYFQDGRYANNAWLQELPRPMTKLTWDNAVLLSPRTAQRLGVAYNDLVEIQYAGRSVTGAVWILPGQPDNSTTIHLGWGRTRAGRAGNRAGFDAYRIRTADALWVLPGALRKTGGTYPLASTQMYQSMEGRNLVISAPVDRYRREPDFVSKTVEVPAPGESLYPPWNYSGYSWGMSIDLTACVNCNACVTACQAENNIPVVGKEQILARRGMHWLRIDTYYSGDPANPAAYYQPIPCMQCENAPCELVCPVQATNHSRDGLNDMVYNRCVGTRYCSNNCPYKVRRFNFFLYQDWVTETTKLQRNPDVTVRSRGVMEKCTYCVQRIREAEIQSQVENRFIRDGEVQTACQQACPTQAIVFGDINNSANQVTRRKKEKLDYPLLAELNTRPRTTYLAELRNPNPEWNGSPE